MKPKLFLLCSFLLFTTITTQAQTKRLGNETEQAKLQRMKWWNDSRFGMFIHWGLYAMPGRHEWVKKYEKMNNEEYQKYFELFNPDLFQPKVWAKKAKDAGMKYMVLTTKHHEGFNLFDSQFTDYKATNTPAKRDLVREYVNACRGEGLKVGFYYSIIDWHHPDYTVDVVHPQRPKDDNEAEYTRLNKGRDMAKYRQYLRNQVTELLTKYGKIDILWLDYSFADKNGHGKGKDDWGSESLIKMIRKLQPGIIINNRLGLNEYSDGADFVTPEQVKPAELAKYKGQSWETCQTFSGSWGYYRDENTWKSNHQLLDLLITSTANGGNLILNVGPTARGEFDYRANNALDSLSTWMHANNKAIYNCTYAPAGFEAPNNTRLTYNPQTKRLYVHLMEYPSSGTFDLKGYEGKVKYAQFLHDNSELRFTKKDGDITLKLPVKKPNQEVPVIELVLN